MHDTTRLSAPRTAPPLLDPAKHALFADLDGTLVEIALRPETVVAGEEVRGLLQAWSNAAGGALAIITGRSLKDADRILGGGIAAIAGVHGLEYRLNGNVGHAVEAEAELAAALIEAQAMVASGALIAGIEPKRGAIALHYRLAPEHESDVRAVGAQIAARHGLRTLPGKMVIEIVAGAQTKGDAVERFMQHAPFVGRVPVAIGDDVTDEDAFAAAARAGGFGIRVGEAPAGAAAFNLHTPQAVLAWLAQSLERAQ